jgi:hypothetical protein
LPETLRLSAVYAAARTKFLLCVGSVFAILLLAFARGFVLLERICFTLSPCKATKFFCRSPAFPEPAVGILWAILHRIWLPILKKLGAAHRRFFVDLREKHHGSIPLYRQE